MTVLAKALLDGQPPGAPASVGKRADRLHEVVGLVEAELTARLRSKEAAEYGVPVELDGSVDALWTILYRRLELLAGYRHRGLDPFVAKPETPLGASLAADRARAEQAAVLLERVFGADGLGFLRLNFREQSEAAGAILRLIKEDELGDALGELVGPTLLDQLAWLHEAYESMVVDQLSAAPSAVQNLRELRLRMATLIERYNIAVLDMLDEDEPESLDVVIAALRPMVTLRELLDVRAKIGSGNSQDEPIPEQDTLAQALADATGQGGDSEQDADD